MTSESLRLADEPYFLSFNLIDNRLRPAKDTAYRHLNGGEIKCDYKFDWKIPVKGCNNLHEEN